MRRRGLLPAAPGGDEHAGKEAATPCSSSAALEEGFDPQAIPNLLEAEGSASQGKRRAQSKSHEMGVR